MNLTVTVENMAVSSVSSLTEMRLLIVLHTYHRFEGRKSTLRHCGGAEVGRA